MDFRSGRDLAAEKKKRKTYRDGENALTRCDQIGDQIN